MKQAGLKFLFLIIGISLFLSNCAYAAKDKVVVAEKDKEKPVARAFLGVYMADVSKDVIDSEKYPYSKGVLVMGIIDDSPAEAAGLKENDIIYIFDGNKVDDTKCLSRLVNNKNPGDRVEIVFFRKGDRKRVHVDLAVRNDSYITQYDWNEYADKMGKIGKRIGKSVGGVFEKYFIGKKIDGLQLSNIDEDMAKYFKVDKNEGILVTGISKGSSAAKAGIKSGDIIIEAGGGKIKSVKDYNEALNDSGDEFTLVVLRRGKRLEFNFKAEDLTNSRYMDFNNKRIYKLKIPGENESFEILSKDDTLTDREILEEVEPLNKDLLIFKGDEAKSLEKNLKDIEDRIKDIEKRLEKIEEK